ncbi:hypothetical protein [Nitratifractor salsuginis]|uniref:hypothetical protein n=1 Tax=Nitratifractor salsuginis TaxID=269261 RepID=UPI0002FF282C|nr:hypothetical protein [Nitratifractor salsuginis]
MIDLNKIITKFCGISGCEKSFLPQIMAEGRKIGIRKVMAHGDELKAIVIKALQQQKPAAK